MEPQVYNNCHSHVTTCVLAKFHLEVESGKSGRALALLSINRSTASTSQPSILDIGNSYYFYRALAGKILFLIFLNKIQHINILPRLQMQAHPMIVGLQKRIVLLRKLTNTHNQQWPLKSIG